MELSYKEAMEFFLELVTENTNLHYKTNLSSLTPPKYSVNSGRRFDKVVEEGSVYCFVEKETGNIYNMSSYENADSHGGWLYCR